MCVAFVVLLLDCGGPVLPIALLALSNALLPTILLGQIAAHLVPGSAGIAFAVVEVLDCSGSLAGNVLFGWLCSATGSYRSGIAFLFVLSVAGLVVMVHLLVSEDAPIPLAEQPANGDDEDSELGDCAAQETQQKQKQSYGAVHERV